MKTHRHLTGTLALLAALLTTSYALANRATPPPATPQSHGDRAYNDALRFARENSLPHFTVRSGGVQRVVVNVPSTKIGAWCNTFSKQNGYLEPFFNASNTSAPGWSMCRIGDRCYQQYGQGDSYRASTWGGRVAFPVSLSQQELDTTVQKIQTSPNGPWNYNGGDPERTGRNCTNWLTYKIGQFTGVTTCSVKHHMSSLVTGGHSQRMTVMAVMSNEPIQNFGQDQLRINWGGH